MKRATEIAKLLICLLVAAILVAVLLAVLNLDSVIHELSAKLGAAIDQGRVFVQDADDTVNDAHKSVLLVPKVINDTRLTLDNANKAAIDERMYFEQEVPGLMARVNVVVDQSKETLAAYQKTGEALTAAARGLQPVEDNAALSLAQLDNLVADPDVKATLANIAATSAATADSAKHADGIMADVHEEADKIVHPPKKKLGFWGSIYAGAQAVHKFEPPLF